ncbi:MAG: tetratricopeptide repeat protein [Pyrinomonadaceae bacterium]
MSMFEIAAKLDPDNPGAELAMAEAFVREKQWASAIPHFRRSIDRGFGVSLIYTYMAAAQEKSGDFASSEATLKEAVSIFPRSSFIRSRLAFNLENQGKIEEAADQLKIGRSFDVRQTNGWYSVIKDGILNAHLNATRDPETFAAPPDLRPQNAIYQYNTDKVMTE